MTNSICDHLIWAIHQHQNVPGTRKLWSNQKKYFNYWFVIKWLHLQGMNFGRIDRTRRLLTAHTAWTPGCAAQTCIFVNDPRELRRIKIRRKSPKWYSTLKIGPSTVYYNSCIGKQILVVKGVVPSSWTRPAVSGVFSVLCYTLHVVFFFFTSFTSTLTGQDLCFVIMIVPMELGVFNLHD